MAAIHTCVVLAASAALLLPTCCAFLPSPYLLPSHRFLREINEPTGRCLQGGIRMSHATAAIPGARAPTDIHILSPAEPFRQTSPGEVSVASCNLLAPTLHGLNKPVDVRETWAAQDRKERVPMAFDMVKRLNADILCLQEVEGGPDHQNTLERLLMDPLQIDDLQVAGYDQLVWSRLHPQRLAEVVGLCVAWRSDRFALVSSQAFARGQLIKLKEIDSGATFCVGNVHLNAFPGQIKGRLKATASVVQRIENSLTRTINSPLDGAAIIAGDFNCDIDSVSLRLLQNGCVAPGPVYERNYRQKLSRQDAASIKHSLRFSDAYAGGLREAAASVTVSLTGRGPGSTDHLLFSAGSNQRQATQRLGPGRKVTLVDTTSPNNSKRRHRRLKAKRLAAMRDREEADSPPPPSAQPQQPKVAETLLRVEAVVATVEPHDSARKDLIVAGLPNVGEGFPSDHMPIGALLKAGALVEDDAERAADADEGVGADGVVVESRPSQGKSGVSLSVRRRHAAHSSSRATRGRHNALVRAVSEWLEARGVEEMLQDRPLHRWKWTEGVSGLTKKSRAPDICCVAPAVSLRDEEPPAVSLHAEEPPAVSLHAEQPPADDARRGLVVVEVTVSSRPDAARALKEKKYQDLPPLLASSSAVRAAGLCVPAPIVIVVSDSGGVPEETLRALEELARWTAEGGSSEEDWRADARRMSLQLSALADPLFE